MLIQWKLKQLTAESDLTILTFWSCTTSDSPSSPWPAVWPWTTAWPWLMLRRASFSVWSVSRGSPPGWGGGLIPDWWGEGLESCGTGRFVGYGGGSLIIYGLWGFLIGGGEYFVLHWDWRFVSLYSFRRSVNRNIKNE